MEIQTIQHGSYTEVVPNGRLDEYWASHLESGLQQVIRGGVHRIRLNMSSVTYLSSAGIRILLQSYKQLNEINGSFGVIEPSQAVRRILDMTRLSPLLILENAAGPEPEASAAVEKPTLRIEHRDGAFEVLEYLPKASMKCRIFGDPALLEKCGYKEQHVRKVSFGENMVGVGLGAFGNDFSDCQGRFG